MELTIKVINEIIYEQVFCNLMYGKYACDLVEEFALNMENQDIWKKINTI